MTLFFCCMHRTHTQPDAISFHDVLRGPLTFSLQRTLGDFICFRPAEQGLPRVPRGMTRGSERTPIEASVEGVEEEGNRIRGAPGGVPVYNFCAAVDDWLMGVTAVVRGEEHIPNTIA